MAFLDEHSAAYSYRNADAHAWLLGRGDKPFHRESPEGRAMLRKFWRRSRWRRRCALVAVYVAVLLVELHYWPWCEEDWYDSGSELDLPPWPSNLLNAPLWNSLHPAGGCGKWQKAYTKFHKEALSGKRPASYLVYTTGTGFPPIIQGIPQAMKGIATVFMLALLTDRVFVLDWKTPPGFENQVSPRKFEWRSSVVFKNGLPVTSVHDIGSSYWFDAQGKSVRWYVETDFDQYFTRDVEVVQSLSYDFTYALLRNRHYQAKIEELELHKAPCLVCCLWHNLFSLSPSLLRSMQGFLRKIGWSRSNDIVFLNIPIPDQHLPTGHVSRVGREVVQCTERVEKHLKLRRPVWILASDNFVVLEGALKYTRSLKRDARVYSRERYTVDIQRQNKTRHHRTLKLPMTEQNALFHFSIGFFLQLNSTVLLSDHRSPYSETMAALRHFYHRSGRHLVYPLEGCRIQRFNEGTQ